MGKLGGEMNMNLPPCLTASLLWMVYPYQAVLPSSLRVWDSTEIVTILQATRVDAKKLHIVSSHIVVMMIIDNEATTLLFNRKVRNLHLPKKEIKLTVRNG